MLQVNFNFNLIGLSFSFSCSIREGLVWEDINWMDNGECLDLIEKVCLCHSHLNGIFLMLTLLEFTLVKQV